MLIEKNYENELHIFTSVEDNESINSRVFFNGYEATSYNFLEKLFEIFPFNNQDHLIDFGCGKGRVLFMAKKKLMKKRDLKLSTNTILLYAKSNENCQCCNACNK